MPIIDPKNQIIVTIGPASCKKGTIKKLKDAGTTSFRINLSHSSNELLNEYLNIFQSANVTPSIDTQGAQIRVIGTPRKNYYELNEVITITGGQRSQRNEFDLTLNHPGIFKQIKVGHEIRIDFHGLVVKVENHINLETKLK